MTYCGCCHRDVEASQWDGLYGVCGECAFEHSLMHYPCDHGAAMACERAGHPHAAPMLGEITRCACGSVQTYRGKLDAPKPPTPER